MTLRSGVPLKARQEFDQGAVSSATFMTGMHLLLSRSPEQEAALDLYMSQQLDKRSANYHKWLTPEQLGQLYGPAQSDVDEIATWLRSRGLTVDHVSPAHTSIAFSGTVQRVEQVFHVSIHAFKANDEEFLSNTADPQVPAALAGLLNGVAQLNTLRPKPDSLRAGSGRIDPEAGRLVPQQPATRGPRPDYTAGKSGDYLLYVVPGDAATIYDTPNSYNANFATSNTSYTGTGVTIGIGGEAAIQTSTVANYRSSFLGDTSAPATTYCTSGQNDSNVTSIDVTCSSSSSGISLSKDSGVQDEAYLDIELAGGLAPGATIHYYGSKDLMSGVQYAIDNNQVDIMSLSWGMCEWGMSTSDNSYYSSLWKQAASQGIAITVSTGDSGAAGCDSSSAPFAIYGLGVNGLGSTPYNIAVGGTDYYKLREQSNFSTYVSTSNSSGNHYRTALGYIPESTWNNSTDTDWNNTSSSAHAYNTPSTPPNVMGGGGGRSSCSTNTSTSSSGGSCTRGYSKPSWQTGTGVPSDGVRDVPDVSLLAANGMDNATWLVCTDDVNSAGYTEDCSKQSNGKAYFGGGGGTSASAPAFAGMLALVQQAVGTRLGLDAVKTLYDLSNSSYSSSVFHDVNVGNNSVFCYDQETDCASNSAGYYFMEGYDTNSGYDLATGLGSVDVVQLIKYWSSASGSASATVSVSTNSSSVYSGQSFAANVTVSGSSSLGTPTGSVKLSGSGYTSSAVSLSGGSANITIPANSLKTGNNTLTVTYSGDLDYASTSGTTSVTVSQSTFSLSAASSSAVSSGSSATSTVTVSTSSDYSGTVSLSCSLTNSPSGANSSYAPSCTLSSSSVSLSSSATSATSLATVTTSVRSTANSVPGNSGGVSSLRRSQRGHERRGIWAGAGSGAVLAFVVVVGIPCRRRKWVSMLILLFGISAVGGLVACSSGSTSKTTGTTAGTYTFTVSGKGDDASATTGKATFTVTVD